MDFHDDYENSLISTRKLERDFSLAGKRIGSPTSIQTANQIDEMGKRLNEGVNNVEIGSVSQDVFDAIPKEHFTEMRQLAKLTDANITVHAPLVDPAGFTEQGWNEEQRLQSERYFKDVIERVYDLDPEGNIPVTTHSSSAKFPAVIWQKEGLVTAPGKEGKPTEKRFMMAIDQDTGRPTPLEYEKKYYLGGEHIWTPEKRLENLNQTSWDQEKLKLFTLQKDKDEIRERRAHFEREVLPLKYGAGKGVLIPEEKIKLQALSSQIKLLNDHEGEIDEHIRTGLEEIHHKFVKYYDEKDKHAWLDKLKDIGKDYQKQKEELNEFLREQNRKVIQVIEEKFKGDINHPKVKEILINQEILARNKIKEKLNPDALLRDLSDLPTPKVYIPVDDFAIKKTSETIANVAFHAYNKFKDKAPAFTLENYLPELPLGRASSLRKAILEGRKKFEDKLVKEKNLSKEEAKEVSEKLLGATWDVGHINFLRKFGYSAKDIEKEAETIGKDKLVKKFHLTDNFGFTDSHLPPGMGNVPIKEQIRAIEKELTEEEKARIKHIVEAGGFVQHFKVSPHPISLAGLGSPLYKYELPSTSVTYWDNIHETYGHYEMGLGDVFTPEHVKMYGAGGFSALPRELGGEMPGGRDRFAEAPTE